jgi:hypothetical protein
VSDRSLSSPVPACVVLLGVVAEVKGWVAGLPPVPVTYRGQAQLGLSPDIVAEHQRRAGWFILAANGLASNPLSATEALQEHKEQQDNGAFAAFKPRCP